MISDLLWILIVAIIAALFWQQRRQSEAAKMHIEHRCEQLNLQLLSIARGSYTFGWPKTPLDITTKFYFEFSTDGYNCYEGYALMKGQRVQQIYMPPYPI